MTFLHPGFSWEQLDKVAYRDFCDCCGTAQLGRHQVPLQVNVKLPLLTDWSDCTQTIRFSLSLSPDCLTGMHGKTQTAVLDLLMITNVNSKNTPGLEKILETFSFHGVFNCFHQLLKAQACLLGVGLWALNVFKQQLNLVVTVFVCFK